MKRSQTPGPHPVRKRRKVIPVELNYDASPEGNDGSHSQTITTGRPSSDGTCLLAASSKADSAATVNDAKKSIADSLVAPMLPLGIDDLFLNPVLCNAENVDGQQRTMESDLEKVNIKKYADMKLPDEHSRQPSLRELFNNLCSNDLPREPADNKTN